MKSRFDVLTSQSDRRSLATFRTSGAAAVVLALLTLSATVTTDHALRKPTQGDTFAMEIAATQVGLADSGAIDLAAQRAAGPFEVRSQSAADDEFAFPANYTGEPSSY